MACAVSPHLGWERDHIYISRYFRDGIKLNFMMDKNICILVAKISSFYFFYGIVCTAFVLVSFTT